MQKRGFVVLLFGFLLLFAVAGVFAQEDINNGNVEEDAGDTIVDGDEIENVDDVDIDSDAGENEGSGEDFGEEIDEDENGIEEGEEEEIDEEAEKVIVCHIPPGNPNNAKTLNVDESAVEDHLGHGDYVGVCDDLTDEEVDEELGDGGSINGFDRFIDRIFKNDIENMKERFAEIRTLVNEGRIEEAKELLQYYREFADNLEREVTPDEREEAVRLAKIIKKAVRAMEERISEGDKDDFEIISEKAGRVEAAAEIAHKIRVLCSELHELGAWDEFERVCKTEDDGPRWQKSLFKDLTDEQRKEAEKFGKILSSCMRTSGQDCDCAGIPHEGMSAMCFEAAPLARACDLEDDEDACDQLDSLEFPDDLPEHLEEVLFAVEEEYGDASYDNHIPGPCREAGINGRERGDREKCFAIMVETEAPPECREAIKEAGVRNERGAREICEKIMFELNAPQECVDAGLRDHKECGIFMFKQNAPQECVDAGLTGENRNDPRKCEEIMRKFDGKNRGPGEGFGPDCRRIEDPKERLKCYDGEEKHFDERFEDRKGPNRGPPGGWPGPCREAKAFDRESCEKVMRAEGDRRFEDTKREEKMCAERCSAEGKAWDFSNGCRCREGSGYESGVWHGYDCGLLDCGQGSHCEPDYGCVPDDKGFEGRDDFEGDYDYYDDEGKGYDESECKDGCSQECPGASRTDCVDGGRRCECYYDDTENRGDFDTESGSGSEGGFDGSEEGFDESEGGFDGSESGSEGGFDSGSDGGSSSGDSGSSGGGSSGDSGGGGGDSGGGEGGGSSEGDGGGAGITGNAFLEYFYR